MFGIGERSIKEQIIGLRAIVEAYGNRQEKLGLTVEDVWRRQAKIENAIDANYAPSCIIPHINRLQKENIDLHARIEKLEAHSHEPVDVRSIVRDEVAKLLKPAAKMSKEEAATVQSIVKTFAELLNVLK